MNLIYAALIAVSMYSKIPVPQIEWNKERMRYSLCFFPLVGAVIGALMLLWMQFGTKLTGENGFYTAVLVLIPVLVSGGIHLDGYLDTCDALSSYQTMERRLEILKDSNSGAFAIIMGGCYFILNYGVFTAVTFEQMKVLCAGYCLSRACSALSIVRFKKARTSGLAAAFSDAAQVQTITVVSGIIIALCAVYMLWQNPLFGSAALAACLLSFLMYRRISYKNFGGMTGDLAGFFLQICELTMACFVVISANLFN
ncbi:MAG: adenosylcobinamide-GDP ribazoletransferase [Eubacteriales bacterium]|nr:adenosylcobinamide-GDP ribazoletransferase [Eubacteriales bacterium]